VVSAKKSTKTSKRTKILCLSHMEDADGISSAALIREAFGGDTVLVDYPGLMPAVESLLNDEKLKSLYICDLGLSKNNQERFVEVLTQLKKSKVSVTYIDHHDRE
jgi:archaea-specific RecJ-like exonuclease